MAETNPTEGKRPATLISEDVKITGTIESAEPIQINGTLDGDLNCQGDAVIGEKATIRGNLTVSSVSVQGSIQGNIVAKDKIELKSSARVQGDIKARRLTVVDGVTFVGKSEVNPSGGPAVQPAQAPAAGAAGGDKGQPPRK